MDRLTISPQAKNQLTTALVVLVVAGSSYLLGANSKPSQSSESSVTQPEGSTTGSVISDIQQALNQPADAAVDPTVDQTQAPVDSSGLVNINQASVGQLDVLPGIGPTKAQAIIDYRTQNGPFVKVDDLEKVKGIGPATVEKLRSKVTI